MNRIDELIAIHCPKGVVFNELGNIAKITIGEFVHKNKQNIGDIYPVYNGGTSYTGLYNKYNNTANKIVISARGANAGHVNKVVVDFWAGNSCYTISFNEKNQIDWTFGFYYLKQNEKMLTNDQQKGGIPAVSKGMVQKIRIPIPPLSIQREIVSILDKFTALEEDLRMELKAELEDRKKQYEYYRNELLSFEGNKVEWKTLGEIGDFIRGKRFVKTDIVSAGVPCIHYGEMYTHYKIWAKEAKSFLEPDLAAKLRFAKQGDVIIVAAGETIEDIGNGVAWLGEEDVVIHDACFSFSHKMNPKYVSYFFQTPMFKSQIKRNISSGKISSINASGLSKAKIPVPSLTDQKRVVKILDNFNALLTDISVGLPAEIEGRRKQYEYYRGKLLTFKTLNEN